MKNRTQQVFVTLTLAVSTWLILAKNVHATEKIIQIQKPTGNLILISKDTSTGLDPIFTRTYKSRSLQNGYFGFGWCVDFDLKLNIIKNRRAYLETCQTVRGIDFIYQNSKYRSVSDSKNFIVEKEGQYWHYENQRLIHMFDSQGRLTYFSPRIRQTYRFKYDDLGTLIEIKTGATKTYYIKTDAFNEKIIKIKSHQSHEFNFTYKHEDLIQVQNIYKNTKTILWQYHYNNLHNLELALSPQRQIFKIQYNNIQDQALNLEIIEITNPFHSIQGALTDE